jgi:hypothetical protein
VAWWGWVLVVPLLVVLLVALLLVWVVFRATVDALTDTWSERVTTHPAVKGRIESHPKTARIGVALVVVGLVPVCATLTSRLRGRYDPAPGVIPALMIVSFLVIGIGLAILLAWWRIADPDR